MNQQPKENSGKNIVSGVLRSIKSVSGKVGDSASALLQRVVGTRGRVYVLMGALASPVIATAVVAESGVASQGCTLQTWGLNPGLPNDDAGEAGNDAQGGSAGTGGVAGQGGSGAEAGSAGQGGEAGTAGTGGTGGEAGHGGHAGHGGSGGSAGQGGEINDGGPDADDGGDGGPDGDAGCLDIPFKLNNMTQYALKGFRGGCDDAHTFITLINQYQTGETDLCVMADDIIMLQVNDFADVNSLEFTTASVPQSMEVNVSMSGSVMLNSDFNTACAQSSGYLTYDVVADDKNPVADGYKFNGNLYMGNLPPSNIFRYKP